MITFIIIALAFVVLFTYIFSRNLQKIYCITEQYSRADFSAPPALSRHSTLRTLHDNIVQMGNKIQRLMQSQHNLTRFVAHECRTPVTTMLFAIEALQHENLSETATNHIASIKQDLADLDVLVGEFLNYARASDKRLNCSAVDINQWLTDCVSKYKDAPKKISLHSTIEPQTSVSFDPEMMKHVLYNLINNALKHARAQIQITAQLQSGTCVIHVDDDGTVIADADKTRIFAAFERIGEETKPGFGLGLNIAETIVKRHHGELRVDDSPLGGVRFSLTIPVLL